MIKPALTLFEKQLEVCFRYAVIKAHIPLCLVPKILNPVDVVFVFSKFFIFATIMIF